MKSRTVPIAIRLRLLTVALAALAACSTVHYDRRDTDSRQMRADVQLCETGTAVVASGSTVLMTVGVGAIGILTCAALVPLVTPVAIAGCGAGAGAIGFVAGAERTFGARQGWIDHCMEKKGYRPAGR